MVVSVVGEKISNARATLMMKPHSRENEKSTVFSREEAGGLRKGRWGKKKDTEYMICASLAQAERRKHHCGSFGNAL